jgi:predicted alpha/beta superfamily hydrolase
MRSKFVVFRASETASITCNKFHNSITRIIVTLAILSVVTGCTAVKDNDPASAIYSERVIIESITLREKRFLEIHLPAQYESSAGVHPVLILLDANQGSYFTDTVKKIETLTEQGKLPQLIIVGIYDTNRLRDMNALPFTFRGENIEGGADKFLTFIEKDVVPFINKRYRTSDFNILSGRSASATFAIFAMLTKPDVFNAIIASSPSFFVNEELIFVKTQELLENRESFNRILFMNLGTKDSVERVRNTRKYAALLREIAPVNFKWEMREMKGEGHVPASSVEDGLLMIFDGTSG